MNELKSCPFCGGEAELSNGGTWAFINHEKGCFLNTRQYLVRTIEIKNRTAIAAWNTRAERTCHNVNDTTTCPMCGAITNRTSGFCRGCEGKR